MFKFHKVKNEQELRFYQMPKILFTGEEYKKLSLGAKAMYSVLRDRQELSIKNNWIDEDDNIYVIFTNKELEETLNLGKSTVIKCKKELEDIKLLANHRVGLGKPNKLYLTELIKETSNVLDINPCIIQDCSIEAAIISSVLLNGGFKTRKQLAEYIGISRQVVAKQIDLLKENGYLGEINLSQEEVYHRLQKVKLKNVCEWCNTKVLATEEHHYPIPSRLGGTETVNICPNCHKAFHHLENLYNGGVTHEQI